MIFKMSFADILLKKQLIFMDPTLIIYKVDGKSLLIMKVITSLIKNKNLLYIYLFECNVKKKTSMLWPSQNFLLYKCST